MNQYESQALREQCLRQGLKETASEKADICLINTCTVTHHADRESRRLIRKSLKTDPKAQIIVTGCYALKNAKDIRAISAKIKIIPQSQKHQIFGALTISDFQGHQRVFVKVQDGCDNFCAYCKVPLVRGRSRSRRLSEVIQEVERLVKKGFKEIVLTGICLADYKHQKTDLADLLSALEKIKGEFRIRLSSLEPQLITDRLISKIAGSDKFCPHFHIPLQSGDNRILKLMNRKYTRAKFLKLIAKIKKKIKNVSITTDVLVGFPGEGENNFKNTVKALKQIAPLRTHIFSFSPRAGTAAFNLSGGINPEIINRRVNVLKGISAKASYNFKKKFLHQKLTVLIEKDKDKQTGFYCGYSENYIRVLVKNAAKKDVNKLIKVKNGSKYIGSIY